MTDAPPKLPKSVSGTELRWLLGDISSGRVSQLEKAGVVVRIDRDRYALRSVPNAIRALRDRSDGPAAWQQARTRLMESKARKAEREEQMFEGSVYPRKLVEDVIGTILFAVRAAFLRIPSRAVPLLEQARTQAQRHDVVENLIFEALDGLVDLNIERVDDAANRARKGDTGATYRDDDDAESEVRQSN
jgi:hypothetical protein